jgi:hypothetical protein
LFLRIYLFLWINLFLWIYLFESPLSEGRAFQILDGANLVGQLLTLLALDGRLEPI